MAVEIGAPAPAFELYDQDRNQVSSEGLKGHKSLVVFIPFPFTGICDAEGCMLRDQLASLNSLDANVVVITVHSVPTIKKWVDENHFLFPVLSDYWPHGETTKAYGAFNETVGAANRATFVLDADGLVQEVIQTDSLGTAREFETYVDALTRIE